MGKTANLELNTTEMSDKISDFVGEYNSNMNMLDDLYGDVQDDASSALSTAQSAETKATAAQTAANNAVTTANSANTTAQSAVSTANSANTTAGQANTKADNAVATANTAKDTADEAKETAETASADVADKADVDGTYDSFTAGGAKQLLSTVYVDDNEPYNFRTAGGSADIGDRMYEEVVGGSIVWNQLIFNGNFALAAGATGTPSNGTITTSNGEMSFKVTNVSGADWQTNFTLNTSAHNPNYLRAEHKIFFHYETMPAHSKRVGPYMIKVTGTAANAGWTFNITEGKWNICEMIKPVPAGMLTGYMQLGIGANASNGYSVGDVDKFRNVFCCDLTAMFGSTIADYIYSLEQGTAGAGVAWFRKLFPKPYYEYNAGELMSVKAGSHDTVGFNAWDEEWEVGAVYINTGETTATDNTIRSKNFCRILPSTTYHATCGKTDGGSQNRYYLGIAFYDVNKKFISGTYTNNLTFTTPADAVYFKITTNSSTVVYGKTYNNDICIHLAWDGERNGEYEPYEKRTYPLANIELRGVPKLDANNQLYYDGDTYASDGTVTRKYAIIDLGTIGWRASATESIWASDGLPNAKATVTYLERRTDFLCTKYTADTQISINDNMTDKTMLRSGSIVNIRDSSYATAEQVKTAMNGVYLIYPLAEPTTETADTFVNPQVVDDFGTEEYTDYAVEAGDRDVAIPVGHNSQYMNNLRAKLEMAPDSPDGDGKYIVQQSNGENAYIPYTADGRLDAIEAKLPAPPSANGTYKLTATVSNNGVTYSWQS